MASLANDTRGYKGAGSTLQLQEADCGVCVKLDTAAGSTVTLPAATGNGKHYRFIVSVVATSNSHIVKVNNTTDVMIGYIATMSDDPATVKAFWAGASDDTITLNRSTTGSTKTGEFIEVEDFAAGVWRVKGMTASTGSEATPFSSTV